MIEFLLFLILVQLTLIAVVLTKIDNKIK